MYSKQAEGTSALSKRFIDPSKHLKGDLGSQVYRPLNRPNSGSNMVVVKDSHIKLLTDNQHKRGSLLRFWLWFTRCLGD